MKKLLLILLAIALVLVLFSCSRCSVKSGSTVELRYLVHGHDIQVVLPAEEAEVVIEILDGKRYSSVLEGVPSCGFNTDVSFKINGRVYCIAGDECGTVMDQGNLMYLHLADEEIEYIHNLFAQYGGKFPWI